MYVTAAKHFFRALKVYPNTPELLDIYKKTVPEVTPKPLPRSLPFHSWVVFSKFESFFSIVGLDFYVEEAIRSPRLETIPGLSYPHSIPPFFSIVYTDQS